MKISHLFGGLMAAGLLLPIPALAQTPAAPQSGAPLTPTDVKPVGDWTVRCFPVASTSPCDMYEELDDKNSRQRVLGVSIAYVPSSDRHVAQIAVPLGVAIGSGAVIKTDSYTSPKMPFRRCDREGCYVELLSPRPSSIRWPSPAPKRRWILSPIAASLLRCASRSMALPAPMIPCPPLPSRRPPPAPPRLRRSSGLRAARRLIKKKAARKSGFFICPRRKAFSGHAFLALRYRQGRYRHAVLGNPDVAVGVDFHHRMGAPHRIFQGAKIFDKGKGTAPVLQLERHETS